MPFTPFHFGPHACAGLPLGRRIDLPVFLLANVAVDLEPLIVMTFRPAYPIHGHCHTFLVGAGVGLLLAVSAWPFRGLLKTVMGILRLPYAGTFRTMAVSAVAGVWFHVLFDSIIYTDIEPLWPSEANPFLGLLSFTQVHLVCRLLIIVAVVLYLVLTWFRATRRT